MAKFLNRQVGRFRKVGDRRILVDRGELTGIEDGG